MLYIDLKLVKIIISLILFESLYIFKLRNALNIKFYCKKITI